MTKKSEVLAVFAMFVAASAFAAKVTVSLTPINRPESGTITQVVATVTNDSDDPAPFVDLKITLRNGAKASALLAGPANPWHCTGAGRALVCSVSSLGARQSADLPFLITSAKEGEFDLRAYAQWFIQKTTISPEAQQTALFYRELAVTNTRDGGEGSLRAALAAAGACIEDEVPCRVSFAIDEALPEEGWYTIRPETPLPAVGGEGRPLHYILDATTQPQSNPFGPEVALDGSALGGGNGLEVRGYGVAQIRGLAIGNFSGNGIEYDVSTPLGGAVRSAIEDNFIGTDPAGLHARPNGGRGISSLEHMSVASISRNLISGNGRSGIFLDYCYRVDVVANMIGVDRDGAPLPNGASGIYFGARAQDSKVASNRIAFNRQFGLAISRRANHIHVNPNSIAHNGVLGIDFGVDGYSGDKYDDYNTSNPYIPPPVLLSAQYDPVAGTTTIHGSTTVSIDNWGPFTVTVYANDVDEPQGNNYVGIATAVVGGTFTLTVPRDLRGKFLAAYGQRRLNLGWSGDFFWTSEFGQKTIAVE
jgi:hypothetical protein